MPKPRKGEKGSDFVSRCVSQVVGEGKTQKQALGQCYGQLRQHRGKQALRKRTATAIRKRIA